MKKTKIWDLTFYKKKKTHTNIFCIFLKNLENPFTEKSKNDIIYTISHLKSRKMTKKNFATFPYRFFAKKSCINIFKMLILYYNIKCDISQKKNFDFSPKNFSKNEKFA